MSVSSIISNLQQARTCAGKCDCCDESQQQINSLSQEINNLKQQINQFDNKYLSKTEKPQIIQQSVASAEQLIVPSVLVLIAKAIEALRPEIKVIEVIAKGAAATANLPALIPIIGVILSLAASAGTLLVLGNRIDAVENSVGVLGNDLSRVLGLLPPIKAAANTAKDLAISAKQDVADLSRFIDTLTDSIYNEVNRRLSIIASELIATVDAKINLLKREAEAAIASATLNLNNKINEVRAALKTEIDGLVVRVSALERRMATAEFNIEKIAKRLNEAIALINDIQLFVREILREFLTDATSSIRFSIDEVRKIANTALDTAKLALSKVANPADATEIPAIKSRIGVIEAAIPGIRAKIGAVEASIPSVARTIVNSIAPPIAQTAVATLAPPLVQSLVPPIVTGLIPQIKDGIIGNITNVINNITNTVTNNVTNIMNVDLTPVINKLTAIDAKIEYLPVAFAGNTTYKSAVTAASAAGTCQTMQPGGCSDNAIKRNLKNWFPTFSAAADALQLALLKKIDVTTSQSLGLNYAQLALQKVMDTKLGKQIPNLGISGGLLRIGENILTDRVLNLIATAASIHNALMLSNSIGQTLGATIDTVVGLFGVRDGNGEAYEITAILGKTIKSWVENVVGVKNAANLTTAFAKANRIYQGASNLYSSVRQLFDSSFQLAETTAENTGKIGNALRDHGVVASNAYNQMAERYQGIRDKKFVRMTESLEKIDSTASSLSMITSDIKDVADEIGEVKEQRDEFKKALQELKPTQKPLVNKPVLERENERDKDSEPPTIKAGDETVD